MFLFHLSDKHLSPFTTGQPGSIFLQGEKKNTVFHFFTRMLRYILSDSNFILVTIFTSSLIPESSSGAHIIDKKLLFKNKAAYGKALGLNSYLQSNTNLSTSLPSAKTTVLLS